MRALKKYIFEYFIAGLFFILLSLNYAGFCFKEMRFLSDEEKINSVVQYIIDTYPKEGDSSFPTGLGRHQLASELNYPRPVPYKDVHDFLEANPDCCKVSRNYISLGGEGDNASFWGCVTGKKMAIVGVRYLFRYFDKSGAKHIAHIEIFPGISNCGELNWNIGEI